MVKDTGQVSGGRKSGQLPGEDKKKRLADALRRNLVKRKDKKETNAASKPSAG